MKFGKYIFKEWEYVNPHDWSLYGYDKDEKASYFSNARVELIKHYKNYMQNPSEAFWIPRFMFGVADLQVIYDETTDPKSFKWNEDEKAKKYINDFIVRMDRLKSFT